MRRGVAVALGLSLLLGGCSLGPPEPAPGTATGGTPLPNGPWRPKPGATFHIQYQGDVDLRLPVAVYDLDGDRTAAKDVAALRQRGVASICYFNAGAFEDFRADKDAFPREVIGEPLDGWPGEFWLDVRRLDVLMPIMAARMDTCARKGFVAVDPDNTDGWQQQTGFPITAEDQLAYQRALVAAARERGLGIGLKNNAEQLPEIGPTVDFAVNEQCVQYRECDEYAEFMATGKPVFNIEYRGNTNDICAARPPGMTTVLKDRELTSRGQSCPA